MRHPSSIRSFSFVAAVLSAAAVVAPGASWAAFAPPELACRAAVGKSATRLAKTLTKVVAGCHKARSRDAALAGTDCNDLAQADLRNKVPRAEQKMTSTLTSPTGRCAGVDPGDVLYDACPAPCAAGISTFTDAASCMVCLARHHVESLSEVVSGTPASPLSSDERRCAGAIGKSSAKLFALIAKDVSQCQAREESAGAMSVEFCTDSAYPSSKVADGQFDAGNTVVSACDLSSFDNLDSCSASQFGLAQCVGEETLAWGQDFIRSMLDLSIAGPTTTTSTTTSTTTTTTTSTLPPPDPQCPDLGELVLLSRDSNIPCTTNGDCAPPRSCNTTAGICVSLSDLDSGWTGHAHNSDLDDGVITRSHLVCPGPAPVCGECFIAGIDPSTDGCRCANNTRTVCDEPFAPDLDDCGGATCDCFFGVPIPLSSAGTPACIVNRYSQDIRGTANLDLGSSSIEANLKTAVFLGITTDSPCPVCGGTCSNNPSMACRFDPDCGAGNTCNQDTANDGIRDGICIDGNNPGLACDVGGVNPSFPARPGALVGGGGYSLDCMPAVAKNISGAGLTLNVTQTTGTQSMDANLPCTGGNCPCKTCSVTPQFPCNSDGDCSGSACMIGDSINPNYSCSNNSDCSNLNLGNCNATVLKCQLATNINCTTNSDCQNVSGPCTASTCTSIGGSTGQAPAPNACTGGSCSDTGDGKTGECTSGPDDQSCDGMVRADGSGILSCFSNADCTANDPLNGACTLLKRRQCFLDPIVSMGVAHTEFPVGAAVFCVPPTSNGSINSVAGLPGPTRVVNQGSSKAFCAGDHGIEYQPGSGGCP